MLMENKGTGVERRRLALVVAAGDEGARSHKTCYDSKYICSHDSPCQNRGTLLFYNNKLRPERHAKVFTCSFPISF